MLVIPEDFAPTPKDQNLSNSEKENSMNKDKVKAKEFAKQGEKI